MLLAIGGIVGGRLFYVLEHGGPLLGTRGFTFDGGVVLAAALIAVYVWRQRLGARYLDVVAVGLPLGVAVGRIGDVINGEHYGPRSDFFLAVRNAHPDALTPNPAFAYHNGGLYEVLLGAAIFAVVWPLRHRLRRLGDLTWLVLGLFAIGRFFEFFVRSDSPQLALGLNNAQWTSLALLAVVAAGWTLTARRSPREPGPGALGGGVKDAGPPSHVSRGQAS
jgi:phosphatidylglycerol---prolipoprotein diacylglyceryl transferase